VDDLQQAPLLVPLLVGAVQPVATPITMASASASGSGSP
jgi:hypothetical protein